MAVKTFVFLQNKNPSCPLYYTNRALCNLKLGNWNEVTEDSKKALDIENNLVKGHFFLGVAMYELGSFEEAIIHLQKGKKHLFYTG